MTSDRHHGPTAPPGATASARPDVPSPSSPRPSGGTRPSARPLPGTAPSRPAAPPPAGTTRFLLLAELCRRLGEHGCGSYLVNPATGGAVLWIDRPAPSRDRIAVAAIERHDGWAYAWTGRWAPVCDLDRVAAHLARSAAS